MNIVIIGGNGEVGRAHAEVLSRKHSVWSKDLGPLERFGEAEGAEAEPPQEFDCALVSLNYHALGHERFLEVSRGYVEQYSPRLLNVLSTVRPGTTAELRKDACHSTTRGLHPNLGEGLLKIAKHVAGPKADQFAALYGSVGITCVTHKRAVVTEILHVLNNSHYGVNLMFADEAARLCREYGVDFYDYLRYTSTHNEGFRRLDHARMVRPVLFPPGGRIGGHCVTQGATLIPKEKRGWLLDALADYNETDSLQVVDEHAERDAWNRLSDIPEKIEPKEPFTQEKLAEAFKAAEAEVKNGRTEA